MRAEARKTMDWKRMVAAVNRWVSVRSNGGGEGEVAGLHTLRVGFQMIG